MRVETYEHGQLVSVETVPTPPTTTPRAAALATLRALVSDPPSVAAAQGAAGLTLTELAQRVTSALQGIAALATVLGLVPAATPTEPASTTQTASA